MRYAFDTAAKSVVSAHLADGRALLGGAGGAGGRGRGRGRAYTGDVLLATISYLAAGGDG